MAHPVTERFLKVFEYLKERGIITSQKEFAAQVGFPESHFPGFRTGKRNVGVQQIGNLYRIYGVSVYYVVIGKEPIMEEERQKQNTDRELEKQLAVERAKVELLEREREQLLKELAFYKDLVKDRLK